MTLEQTARCARENVVNSGIHARPKIYKAALPPKYLNFRELCSYIILKDQIHKSTPQSFQINIRHHVHLNCSSRRRAFRHRLQCCYSQRL
jgi:hypothetical protein